MNNNFMDMASLEWCKLFAERNGEHHWKRTVTDHIAFKESLFGRLRMDEKQFIVYLQQLERERDKFIAHFDREQTMHAPQLEPFGRLPKIAGSGCRQDSEFYVRHAPTSI